MPNYSLEDIEVRKYSLKYEPPTLIIEYLNLKSSKTLHRKIRFKRQTINEKNPDLIVDKIIATNSDILSQDSISVEQLTDLVRLLLFSDLGDDDDDADEPIDISGASKSSHLTTEAHLIHNATGKSSMLSNTIVEADKIFGDLNKSSDEENKKAKALMDLEFEKNRVKMGNNEFEYDKRIDFGDPEESNEWDD